MLKSVLTSFKLALVSLIMGLGGAGLYAADLAYVTNQAESSISVIDIATNTVVATIPAIAGPNQIAATPDGTLVYFTNSSSPADYNVIDTPTNTIIATITIPGESLAPVATATTMAGTFAYLGDEVGPEIFVIDTSNNNIVATIPLLGLSDVTDIATSSAAELAYAAASTPGIFEEINLTTNTVTATINLIAGGPLWAALNSDASLAYCGIGNIRVIDTTLNSVVATIPLGGSVSTAGAVTPDDAFVYVCVSTTDSVIVIDTGINSIVATIPVGDLPTDIVITADGAFAYVTNSGTDNVSVINLSNNSIIATVPVGDAPRSITIAYGVFPPTPPTSAGVRGEQISNRFLTQTDLINVVTWSAPSNFTPVFYRIFRDAGLTELAGVVSASDELKFEDHNRRKKQFYAYFVVAVAEDGTTFTLGSVTVFPIS